MKKLVLKNRLSPGDIVMLTAAVRDLHRCYPNQFVTDVRTSCPDLWLNNPHITRLREDEACVEVIECSYPLINRCDRAPYHCLHGFIEFLNERLGLQIRPTEFKGDIHLSPREKAWFSQVHESTGEDTPFWIVVAGGKFDVTIKWWEARRFQEVVDHFRGRIQFVQVGDASHYHPKLEGVIDLRGRTNLRQLVRLVYHAQGVLCPVTALMHLAAAVETKGGQRRLRPCVVIAGGREPVHWEAYPGHQFLHTIGALPCCATEGCWKARTVPLGDGEDRDEPERICVNVVGDLPRCMDMISLAEVIRRIETYFDGGAASYLAPSQVNAAARGVAATSRNPMDDAPLNIHTARLAMNQFIPTIRDYPGGFHGRGIVICGGGVKYFTPAWVCVNLLRRLGCTLPIQLWHLGPREVSEPMKSLLAPLGVECVDALEVRQQRPARILGGWQLKPYAILHSPFKEVLLLDADNVPVVNPEFLFETAQFKETGAVFWPDAEGAWLKPEIFDICGIVRRDDRPVESGQIVVDKERCWRALRLTMWCNEHSDFFYKFMHGDTGTYPLAFRKLNQPLAIPATPMRRLSGVMHQHDFQGNRIFQHRNDDKWNLFLANQHDKGFLHEAECFELVRRLREIWDGRVSELKGEWATQMNAGRGAISRAGDRNIAAYIISRPEREKFRCRTEENLRTTDWDKRPIGFADVSGPATSPTAALDASAFAALEQAITSGADYALLLADELEFNRFIFQNLHGWPPLRDNPFLVASLFNPGIPPVAANIHENCFVAESSKTFGSACFLIARAAAQSLLKCWYEVTSPLGLKIPQLAARLRGPIFYHVPSLVQHTGNELTWGGSWRRACDFDPDWQATR